MTVLLGKWLDEGRMGEEGLCAVVRGVGAAGCRLVWVAVREGWCV